MQSFSWPLPAESLLVWGPHRGSGKDLESMGGSKAGSEGEDLRNKTAGLPGLHSFSSALPRLESQ